MTRKYRNKIQQRTFQNFMTEAKFLMDKRILTDFTLECEGDVFPVHRMVLAASSPYFRDYFTQQENIKQTTIKIDFMKSNVLQMILEYFYTGRINIKKEQSQELVKNLLEASSELQIPLLYDYCLELLLNKQSKGISLLDWKTIEELNNEITNKNFLKTILKKLPSLPESEAFLQCHFNQINRLLFGPEAKDCDQSIVLQCILTWIKHDSIGRKEYLTTFLEKVDFERINPTQFLNFKQENLLIENRIFQTICISYLFKHVEILNNEKIHNSNIRREITEYQGKSNTKCKSSEISSEYSVNSTLNRCEFKDIDKKFLIFWNFTEYFGMRIFMYDYSNNIRKEMIAHPLYSFKQCHIANYKNSIYCFRSNEESRNFYVYNVKTNQWSEPDFVTERLGVAAVELNGCIYDVGGDSFEEDEDEGKSVLRIDPESFESKYVASLPAVNKNGTVPIVSMNDCLFAWLDKKLYKYIPKEDKWYLVETELNNKIETEEVHLATGNDRIFIIEKSEPKNIWIYDPTENSLSKDFVPSVLKEYKGILNLENPQQLEFLVRSGERWPIKCFIYRPYLHSWIDINPKMLNRSAISNIILLPS